MGAEMTGVSAGVERASRMGSGAEMVSGAGLVEGRGLLGVVWGLGLGLIENVDVPVC